MKKASILFGILALVASVCAAGELDFVLLTASAVTTNPAVLTTQTNTSPLRGVVRSVQIVKTGAAGSNCTVTVATVGGHTGLAQTLYPATALSASVRTYPCAELSTNTVAVPFWTPIVLTDDYLTLRAYASEITNSISIRAIITYERMF